MVNPQEMGALPQEWRAVTTRPQTMRIPGMTVIETMMATTMIPMTVFPACAMTYLKKT
jgi:hypothetical protein